MKEIIYLINKFFHSIQIFLYEKKKLFQKQMGAPVLKQSLLL